MRRILIAFLTLGLVTAYGAFDTPDIDARAKAIGGAITAKAVSGSTIIANAALLSSFEKKQLTINAQPMSRGLNDGAIFRVSGNTVIPMGDLTGFGVSINALLVQADSESLYQEFEGALGLGRTLAVHKAFSYGVTAMLQWQNINDDVVTEKVEFPLTFNANIGVAYSATEALSFGLAGKNLIGMNTANKNGSGDDSVPRQLAAGVTYGVAKYLAALDLNYVVDTQAVNIKLGAETYLSNDKFIIGMGVEFLGLTDAVNPSVGFGMDLGLINANYSITYPLLYGSGVGDHLLSVTVKF